VRVGIKTGLRTTHQLSLEMAGNHAHPIANARLDADPKGRADLGAFHRRRSPCVVNKHFSISYF
jgi:hypothetical protein